MAFSKVVAIVFALVAASEASGASALMYIVGEAQGWTFNVDYNAWASNKNFVPGDVLVFQYNPQAHSVFSVSQGDYNSCNLGSPVASYASGNDQVTLSQPGNYYFLCGTPGHCQGGMKVAVTVGGGSGSTSTTPTTPSTPSGTPTTPSVTPTTPSLTPTTPSVTPSTPAVTCAPNAPSPPSTFPMDPSRRAAAAAGVPCYSFQLSVFLATLVFGAIDLLN